MWPQDSSGCCNLRLVCALLSVGRSLTPALYLFLECASRRAADSALSCLHSVDFALCDSVTSVVKVSNYRAPNPEACIAFFDMSLVDEMPCMRSLKSSAFDAFSSAVS